MEASAGSEGERLLLPKAESVLVPDGVQSFACSLCFQNDGSAAFSMSISVSRLAVRSLPRALSRCWCRLARRSSASV